jgi:hypothetical protein
MATNIHLKLTPTGGLQQSPAGITLKNTIATALVARLDNLADVVPDTANTAAGSTLVYDSVTDKYVVKLLDLDGGNF